MWPRSSRFDQVLRGQLSAHYTVQISAYRSDAISLSSVPFIAGTVSFDLSATSRRGLQLEVVDKDGTFTPTTPRHPLSAYGNELFVRAGFTYSDTGLTELLPIGWFWITSSTPTSQGRISITASDRSKPISDAKFETVISYPPTTPVMDAITDIVETRRQGLTYSFHGSPYTLPLTLFEEGDRDDPWDSCVKLAKDAGQELYFDAAGVLVCTPRIDPANVAPVWEYRSGPNQTKLSAAGGQELDGVRNVWIVTGEGSGNSTPVRASSEITDATSPIHPGIIGRRPRFYSTPQADSAGRAMDIANQMKAEESGVSEKATFSAVPHLAHEPGDVVRLVDTRLGMDSIVVLSKWDLDLKTMSAATFETLGRRYA